MRVAAKLFSSILTAYANSINEYTERNCVNTQNCAIGVIVEIKREIWLNKLIQKKHNGLVKVITGIRRCGKSYLLFNLFKAHLLAESVTQDHIIEMSFDSFEAKKYRDPEVLYPYVKSLITDNEMYYILFDEVQLLGEFETVLNGFLRIKNVDVYVTGSNAKFLSKDISSGFKTEFLRFLKQ